MKSIVFNTAMTLGLLQSFALTASKTIGPQANFSANLFATISEQNMKKNVIISPASIQTALALTYIGAEGDTATELIQGLNLGGINVTKEQVAKQFEILVSKMRSSGNATLKMANRIYVKKGLRILPKFTTLAERYFAADAESVDFGDNVKTAKQINNWVENQTENKIHDVISPKSLDNETAAVLVNAIYFKATWIKAFDKSLTTKQNFYLSETNTKKVDMMNAETNFHYTEFGIYDATALSMRYFDTNIRMLVLLPNKLNGLEQLEHQLREVDLPDLLNYLSEQNVVVTLPKFKIEFDISLQPNLEKLGMRNLFNDTTANFKTLANDTELFVSKVVHKAFIEVDERGTEVAVSTVVEWRPIFAPAVMFPKAYFTANHPFFFALLDDDTVYFTGHVVDI